MDIRIKWLNTPDEGAKWIFSWSPCSGVWIHRTVLYLENRSIKMPHLTKHKPYVSVTGPLAKKLECLVRAMIAWGEDSFDTDKTDIDDTPDQHIEKFAKQYYKEYLKEKSDGKKSESV